MTEMQSLRQVIAQTSKAVRSGPIELRRAAEVAATLNASRPTDNGSRSGKVGPMNCSRCGRFVWGADCGLVWDEYCGGWEADPLCKRCKGDTDA